MGCPNDYPYMIWEPFERILWGCALTIAVMCGIYFIHLARKREIFNERIIMLGLASLPLGFGFSLFFTYIQVLQVPGDFIKNVFCGIYEDNVSYVFFGRLSYISFGIGGMFFVLAFEIIIKRTKFILSTIFLIIIIIAAISRDFDVTRDIFNYLLILTLVFFVPLVLYLYTKWSHLEFKAVSSFILFGFILFMISLILAERAHKRLNYFPLIMSPLLLILGCSIMLLPIIINPKIISRALTYWIIFAVLTFPFLIYMIIIDTYLGLMRDFEGWYRFIIEFTVAFLYILLLFLLIIENIGSEINLLHRKVQKIDEDSKADLLRMFTRPQHVNFLASISHELRTPLTAIIGFTQTILKGRVGDINEEQKKQLNIVLNSANHLHELITDVIDMTKIEVNKFNVKKENFDLINDLREIVETFHLTIKEKGLEIFMDTPENFKIYSDKKRISQILLNLIGNAVKFTEKGKISIKIRTTKREITISVKDSGPGIKAEDLKKLFIPFSRIIEPGKVKEGVGLGLHLSKKLASLLGGDILVKSKYGKGSTFKLVLKMEDSELPNLKLIN